MCFKSTLSQLNSQELLPSATVLDKPQAVWIQASLLLSHPRHLPSLLSRKGFSIPAFTFLCSSILIEFRISPIHALALSACRFVRKSPLDSNLRPRPQYFTWLTIGPPGTPAIGVSPQKGTFFVVCQKVISLTASVKGRKWRSIVHKILKSGK